MSFRLLLFIQRLHRNQILMTIGELNMNDCTRCRGTGWIREWIETPDGMRKETMLCPDCGGYGELEDVAK